MSWENDGKNQLTGNAATKKYHPIIWNRLTLPVSSFSFTVKFTRYVTRSTYVLPERSCFFKNWCSRTSSGKSTKQWPIRPVRVSHESDCSNFLTWYFLGSEIDNEHSKWFNHTTVLFTDNAIRSEFRARLSTYGTFFRWLGVRQWGAWCSCEIERPVNFR